MTIISLIDHYIGALCGALLSAAVKCELSITHDEIASLRADLSAAAEAWMSARK